MPLWRNQANAPDSKSGARHGLEGSIPSGGTFRMPKNFHLLGGFQLSNMTLLIWNPWVGNSPRRVRRAVNGWARRHNPDVIVISEARPFYGTLRRIPGYRVFQERPAPKGSGIVDDRGDTAILVRDGIPVRRRRVVRMGVRWRVFSHNRTHTPRRYETIKVEVDGQWWSVRGSHYPTNGFDGGNRRAFLESAARSKAWALICRTPTVDAGDLNESAYRLRKFFGRGFKIRGHRIDLIITRRVRRIEHRMLAKRGSDSHRGQLFHLTA